MLLNLVSVTALCLARNTIRNLNSRIQDYHNMFQILKHHLLAVVLLNVQRDLNEFAFTTDQHILELKDGMLKIKPNIDVVQNILTGLGEHPFS